MIEMSDTISVLKMISDYKEDSNKQINQVKNSIQDLDEKSSIISEIMRGLKYIACIFMKIAL
jgi:hypothetical protein